MRRGGTIEWRPGFGRCQADRAAEGLERHASARAIHGGRQSLRIIFPDMQCRVLELIGEQAEARNIRGPAPARGREIEERHLDCIARLRAFDIDRTRHRIDLGEIERRDVGDASTSASICPPEEFDRMKLDRLAGRNPRRPAGWHCSSRNGIW